MNHSLYIHIPFCRHRCAYCDFNTYAGQETSIPAYVRALAEEIEFVGASAPERIPVHTVFFGGGTPSLLSPDQFQTILDAIRRNFDLSHSAEITTEANPGTVSFGALQQLRDLGINRVSFGAQSANGEELRMLERTHSFLDVMEAVSSARRAGFTNLNLDLIYGLPEQTLATWITTVKRTLDLQPEHVSAYALTLEHGTPFGNWSARGLIPTPNPDTAAEMYEWASAALEEAGYFQYEISNWARERSALSPANAGSPLRYDGQGSASTNPEPIGAAMPRFACSHNLQYWRCLPYLGLGAGAHGYAHGTRYSNVLRIKTYIERMDLAKDRAHANQEQKFPLSPAAVNQHRQTPQDDMSEFMIMGLRLTREGVSPAAFRDRFGQQLDEVYAKETGDLQRLQLLEWTKNDPSKIHESTGTWRLTSRGRLLGNQVFMRFV